jgi:methionyl-tRNA formyltransferase
VKKEEGLIDWSRPAEEIARRVRAFNPWPSAYTFWNGVQLKILKAQAVGLATKAEPGRVVRVAEDVAVATGEGALVLQELQLAGKRAMSAEELVRGRIELVGSALT